MGDWGVGGGFGGESFLLGGGKEEREGGLFVIFMYLLTIPLVGISLLGFFSPVLFFSFPFRKRRFLRIIFFFFFFSAISLFLMKLRLPPP